MEPLQLSPLVSSWTSGDRQPRMRLSPLQTGAWERLPLSAQDYRESRHGGLVPILRGPGPARTRIRISAVECIDLASSSAVGTGPESGAVERPSAFQDEV